MTSAMSWPGSRSDPKRGDAPTAPGSLVRFQSDFCQITKKVLPNYEHHEVPGTGHFVMMEKPREFNALLTAFVDKLPAR